MVCLQEALLEGENLLNSGSLASPEFYFYLNRAHIGLKQYETVCENINKMEQAGPLPTALDALRLLAMYLSQPDNAVRLNVIAP